MSASARPMTDPTPPSPPDRTHGPLPSLYWPTGRITNRVVRLKDAETPYLVAARDWGLPVYRLEAPRSTVLMPLTPPPNPDTYRCLKYPPTRTNLPR